MGIRQLRGAPTLSYVRGLAPDLKILIGPGDSHTEGRVPVAAVSGAEKLGVEAPVGPGDWCWNGTAFAGGTSGLIWPAAPSLGSDTGTRDPNASATPNQGSFASFLPFALRSRYALANIRIGVYGVGGVSSYTITGEQADAFLQVGVQPNAGDTFTLGAQTYTFRASAGAEANAITIAATAILTARNIENAINAEGSGFGTGTTANLSAFCPNARSDNLVHIYCIASGTGGNSTVLTESSSAARLNVYQAFGGGSATSAIWSNMLTSLAGGSGFGTPDVVVLLVGTNDATRPGYRARGFATEMAKLLATIGARWPNAKIVLWMPPKSTSGSAWDTAMARVVAAVPGLATGNVSYVDLNTPGLGSGNVLEIGADGIHGTHLFYASTLPQIIAAKIGSVLSLV